MSEVVVVKDGVTYTQMDADSGGWECSGCGEAWWLNDGDPFENHMRYCPFCGRMITDVKAHVALWGDEEARP